MDATQPIEVGAVTVSEIPIVVVPRAFYTKMEETKWKGLDTAVLQLLVYVLEQEDDERLA